MAKIEAGCVLGEYTVDTAFESGVRLSDLLKRCRIPVVKRQQRIGRRSEHMPFLVTEDRTQPLQHAQSGIGRDRTAQKKQQPLYVRLDQRLHQYAQTKR